MEFQYETRPRARWVSEWTRPHPSGRMKRVHGRDYGTPKAYPAGSCRRTPAGGVTRAPAWRPRARPGVRMDPAPSIRAHEARMCAGMGRLGLDDVAVANRYRSRRNRFHSFPSSSFTITSWTYFSLSVTRNMAPTIRRDVRADTASLIHSSE